MNWATLIFGLTYLLVSLGENSPRKLDRPTATLLGAVLMVIAGVLTRAEVAAALDLKTLAILFGMMVLLAVLMQSGLPTSLARRALHRCKSPHSLLALVVFTSGISSAVMLNDTVCLLGTPLVVEIAAQAEIPALPFLIALATSANIGSVMTLTGNPQNIIIGHASGWAWSDFAARMVPIGLILLGINWLLLEGIYRRQLSTALKVWHQPADLQSSVHRRLAFKSVSVFAGLTVTFLAGVPMDFAAVSAAMLLLVWANRPPREALEAIDWSLLLFFAGLFVVVEGFARANGPLLNDLMGRLGGEIGLVHVLKISAGTVAGSNIFSNVPFVLIAGKWISGMQNPHFMWMLVALSSTLAGNLTLFGSVANVIVAQGAQRSTPLNFMDFLKAGMPITIVTTTLGVLVLWLMFTLAWI